MDGVSEKHPNFHFVPALSNQDPAEAWNGEIGFIADVIGRKLENADNAMLIFAARLL